MVFKEGISTFLGLLKANKRKKYVPTKPGELIKEKRLQ